MISLSCTITFFLFFAFCINLNKFNNSLSKKRQCGTTKVIMKENFGHMRLEFCAKIKIITHFSS